MGKGRENSGISGIAKLEHHPPCSRWSIARDSALPGSDLDRTPFEGKSKRLRLALAVIGIDLLDDKACFLDQFRHPPGEVTPTRQSLVQRLEATLPPSGLSRRVVTLDTVVRT